MLFTRQFLSPVSFFLFLFSLFLLSFSSPLSLAYHIDDSFEQPHSSLRRHLYPLALAQRTWHPWRALGPSLGEGTKTHAWRRWGWAAKSSLTHKHSARGTESLQGHPQGFPVLHVDRFAGHPAARHTESKRPEGVRSCLVRDRPRNRDLVASWWSRCCGIGSRKARRETKARNWEGTLWWWRLTVIVDLLYILILISISLFLYL